MAALAHGLQVRGCHEPRYGDVVDPATRRNHCPTSTVPDPWLLHATIPAAANAAYRELPIASFWHFQLST